MHENRSARRLTGHIKQIGELTASEQDQMYHLMACYYDNVTRCQFEQDLTEKEWVALLTDTATSELQGFSTAMRLQVTIDEQPIVALFSGDTIVQRDCWGETVLPRLMCRYVFELTETLGHIPIYWFLISSGYKTYRFLPVFFREFYPTYQHPTPPTVQRVLDTLACSKFSSQYDPTSGIVRLDHPTPLRPGIAELTPQRLQDPHVAFFLSANPGHTAGDELACITRLTRTNLTPVGQRILRERTRGE